MSYVDFISSKGSRSNVPEAKYIDDVEKFVGNKNPAELTQVAKELLSKYRFMEKSTSSKMFMIKEKIPELKDALHSLDRLKKKTEIGHKSDSSMYFKISDTLYSEAKVPYTETAYLWLGYPLDDAIKLLSDQHKGIESLVIEMDEELDWIKRQITCTEITVARLHNFTVMKNAKEKEQTSNIT